MIWLYLGIAFAVGFIGGFITCSLLVAGGGGENVLVCSRLDISESDGDV
jgi:hypothetical protein